MNLKITKVISLFFIVFVLYKLFEYFQKNEEKAIVKIKDIPKIKISVYYEALCPDSRFFVAYQLLPTFREFQTYLSLDLIPYGKAETIESGGKIEFQCQHYALECYANKIHACVIDLVEDPLVQLEYISCMIKNNMVPDESGERCAIELNINYGPIADCANNLKGSQLLKKFGDKTHALNPSVTFIPTIELNNDQNLVPQTLILKDLKKALCLVFKDKPIHCL